MTDRLNGCTVVFEKDIREDDAEAMLHAIRMIKGVLSVAPALTTHDDWRAEERVRREFGEKLLNIIYPDKP